MVKYTVAASVALVQMAMFARTSVALPMEQQRRDLQLSDLDARDWKEFVKRYINDELDRREDIVSIAQGIKDTSDKAKNKVHNTESKFHQAKEILTSSSSNSKTPADPQQTRRDLSDLYERGWDEYEKRSFNDIEERGWNEYQERDWDEYEERSFNDIEERDWNEFQERDWDDDEMEARGLDFDELDELD
ncbi:hypothetical protein APHAL10511_007845 [Amanita phalloides]|nr:hypothetical protein APHAL10511_007845 [Amanita phalloides]